MYDARIIQSAILAALSPTLDLSHWVGSPAELTVLLSAGTTINPAWLFCDAAQVLRFWATGRPGVVWRLREDLYSQFSF